MASLPITTSPNIAELDFAIKASLCEGKLFLDVLPTVYIGDGAAVVLGASFKIVNPYGVTIRNYVTSGYDISQDSPPMTGEFEYPLPTQAGNYQYGAYKITVRMTDADGTEYELEKTVKICEPDSKHKTRNYGSLSAKISGICKEGKTYIVTDTPPNYNGKSVESSVYDLELLYPTESQLDPLDSSIPSFSVQLYEGEYKLSGTICATYNYGDNVTVKVNYKVKRSKTVKCIIDECCVLGKLTDLSSQLGAACTEKQTQELSSIVLDTLRLLKTAQLAAECGEDSSDYVTELESLLGCKCTCDCNEGTPIINNNPVRDYVIDGCNVTVETVGLTTTYTIGNFEYLLSINQNGGALTVSEPTINGCVKTFPITFNIAPVYNQIKALANTDYNSWTSIINKGWNDLDATCLGHTTEQWNTLTYSQRSQLILNALCRGGTCDAVIEADETQAVGDDVVISWTEVSGVYEVAVYVDDILRGTVRTGTEEFSVDGIADGQPHTYSIASKCANGVLGNVLDGSFTYFGCPVIASPTVTAESVTDVDCPYDLTALVNDLPAGIEAEWHNAYNTNSNSLVLDPTQVGGGAYWVYAVNSDGCYSAVATKVIVYCEEETGCSAPQNPSVETITGGFRVRFQSAAFPPSSYTVKRRLTTDDDIDANYTTIGTPSYNGTVSRWEILDATPNNNVSYTYKIISNCPSTAPYVLYSYAEIDCPTLSLTPHEESIDYSFVPLGGAISEYKVDILSNDGSTIIHTDTFNPAFSNPITGTFVYLTDGTNYKVRLRVTAQTTTQFCPLVQTATIGYNYRLSASYNMTIASVTGTGNPGLPTTGANGTQEGMHDVMSGTQTVNITGSAVPNTKLILIVDGVVNDCADVSAGAGAYPLDLSSPINSSNQVEISIVLGTC